MITIRTNRQYRNLLSWYELTPKEQAEFDYLDTEDKQAEAEFVRYRGVIYHTHEFVATRGMPDFNKWHGYSSDSFFSGVLLRYSRDFESVMLATYYS